MTSRVATLKQTEPHGMRIPSRPPSSSWTGIFGLDWNLLRCTLPTATPYFRRSVGEEVPRHENAGTDTSGK